MHYTTSRRSHGRPTQSRTHATPFKAVRRATRRIIRDHRLAAQVQTGCGILQTGGPETERAPSFPCNVYRFDRNETPGHDTPTAQPQNAVLDTIVANRTQSRRVWAPQAACSAVGRCCSEVAPSWRLTGATAADAPRQACCRQHASQWMVGERWGLVACRTGQRLFTLHGFGADGLNRSCKRRSVTRARAYRHVCAASTQSSALAALTCKRQQASCSCPGRARSIKHQLPLGETQG